MARTIRVSLMGLLLASGFSPEIQAAEPSCPIVGQHDMLMVQLFFGQSEEGREIKPEEWKSFLADTVTPRFPFGFTVYNGDGQWTNPRTHTISREKSKVILIVTDESPATVMKIDELLKIYRKRFHQESVGIVTSQVCSKF